MFQIYENSELVRENITEGLAHYVTRNDCFSSDMVQMFTEVHNKRSSTTVSEISVIRFPTKEEPYIKLFHINATAFHDSVKIMLVNEQSGGLILDVNVETFKAIDSYVATISDEMADKIVDDLSNPEAFNF